MTTKHTPGSWDIFPSPDKILIGPIESHSNLVRRVAEIDSVGSEDHANARLIAAAPDLLEALETIVRYANNREMGEMKQAAAYLLEYTHCGDLIKEAIAKATGE